MSPEKYNFREKVFYCYWLLEKNFPLLKLGKILKIFVYSHAKCILYIETRNTMPCFHACNPSPLCIALVSEERTRRSLHTKIIICKLAKHFIIISLSSFAWRTRENTYENQKVNRHSSFNVQKHVRKGAKRIK